MVPLLEFIHLLVESVVSAFYALSPIHLKHMPPPTIYTIGHSTHSIETFLALLRAHGVTCIIDVRSQPYSGMAPHFNKSTIQTTLKREGVLYAHFKEEFGARHTDPTLLDTEGRVDFDKVRETAAFKRGIERLQNAIELGYRVALMCSEANPFDCHRFVMVSYQLAKEGMEVRHILGDGQVLPNEELEIKLLEKYAKKLPQSTLFETVTDEMRRDAAYRLRNKAVGFVPARGASEETDAPTDKEYDD